MARLDVPARERAHRVSQSHRRHELLDLRLCVHAARLAADYPSDARVVNFTHPTGRAQAAAAATAASAAEPRTVRGFFGVFRYSRRALELVWRTNPGLTVALGVLTLIAGVVPAGVAYIGSLIVDAVVAAVKLP